jgi:hypothetical protein
VTAREHMESARASIAAARLAIEEGDTTASDRDADAVAVEYSETLHASHYEAERQMRMFDEEVSE